jgi:hypothetical protein
LKVVAKKIEVIALFGDIITPIKFRHVNEQGETEVIKVNKVITRVDEKLCGNRAIIFDCQSVIGETEKRYQIKYFIEECKWVLWKF